MALDSSEVIENARMVFARAMEEEKYGDALKANEQLGNACNAFKSPVSKNTQINIEGDVTTTSEELDEETIAIMDILNSVKSG